MRLRLFLLGLLLTTPAMAAEYFVGPTGNNLNACTLVGSPCATIAGAIGKSSGCDTITILAGTYSGNVDIPNRVCTTPRFIVRGDPAAATNAVVVQGKITVGVDDGNSRRGYTVQHLRLASTTVPMVDFTCSGSSATEVRDVTFDDIAVTSIPSPSLPIVSGEHVFGILAGESCSLGGGTFLFQNLNVTNGGTRSNVMAFEGFWSTTVQDSLIADINGRIFFGSSRLVVTFTRNTFRNILGATVGVPPNQEGDAVIVGYNNQLVITNNVFDGVSGNDAGNGVGGVVNSRFNGSTTSATVTHNTFISHTSVTSPTFEDAYYADSDSMTAVIRDNIFIDYGGSDSRDGAIRWWGCPSSKTESHNLFYLSAGSRDIGDSFDDCGGDNAYGTGDIHNGVNPFSGCSTPATCPGGAYVPPAGSTACSAASDGTSIGAKACAGSGGGDTVAPSSISNLSVLAPTKAPQLGAILSWTAPSDSGTGSTGSAVSYILVGKGAATGAAAPTIANCADGASLTAVLSSTGTFVTVLPTPKTAGLTDSFTVKALRPNWQYAFAICSSDAAPNQSGLSNVVNITTTKVEGYGYQSTGGGFTGSVAPTSCAVSSLADSGAGSLRSCVASDTYVGFSLGGTINLESLLNFQNISSYTIDGSTAPSPGITIQSNPATQPNGLNDMLQLGQGTHAIWGWLRVTGKKQWPSGSASNTDLGFTNDTSVADSVLQHLVMTHLTIRNVGDGAWDMWDNVQDASLANNLIVFNQHPQTTGGDNESARMSWYRNANIHNGERQPQFSLAHADMDLRNNIHYDWSYGNSAGSYAIRLRNLPAGAMSANIVNNMFVAGTNTTAMQYGASGGCDAEEGTCAGCSAQASNGTSSLCSTTTMGELWVSGNTFTAGVPADTYSTVAAERTVTAAAAVTTVAASALCTAVLSDVGTHFPLSDETAAIGDAFTAMSCSGGAVCGDALINGGEVCDGANLGGQTCITQGFAAGTLSCSANCLSFNVSLCQVEAGKSATIGGVTCSGCTVQ